MKVIVLGAGLVGGPIALDLAEDDDFDVTIADVNDSALLRFENTREIETVRADLSNKNDLKQLVGQYDMVVSAVPGYMGYSTIETVVETGKNVVDIAFFPQDPFKLGSLAREKGVTAVVDCGVAPGLSNMLVGYVDSVLDETKEVAIYVGGLPEVRELPFEYKAVFSPADVMEEYIRPARLMHNGKMITKPALSDVENIFFPGVGTLEAFNTDGLRTLVKTIDAPNMKEKTVRYPGHAGRIRLLKDAGFLEREKIEVDGVGVSPLDFTSRILFPRWKFNQGDIDITVMQVEVSGKRGDEEVVYSYQLYDRYHEESGVHSMARTTGYTATLAFRLIASGVYSKKGLIVPEYLGRWDNCLSYILKGLRQRGVKIKEQVEKLHQN
jgi:lysine 6-dehydrogenase